MRFVEWKWAAPLLAVAALTALAVLGPPTTAQQEEGKADRAAKQADRSGKEADRAGWGLLFRVEHARPVTVVAAGGEWLAAGTANGDVFLLDAATGEQRRHALIGGQSFKSVERLQFQRDGKYLWVVVNGRTDSYQIDLLRPGASSQGSFSNLGVSADGEWWLETHSHPTDLMIRPNLAKLTAATAHRDYEGYASFDTKVVDAVFSPDPAFRWVAVLTADNHLRTFAREALNRDHKERAKGTLVTKRKVEAFVFSQDGQRLAVVGPGPFAAVYQPGADKPSAVLAGHRGTVHAVAFSPDGTRVATGGADLTVRLWDAATGKEVAVIEGHQEAVRAVAFSPDGRTLYSGSNDGTVRAWREAKPAAK